MIEATVQQQKLTEDELKQLELKKKAKQTIDEEAKRQKAQADQLLKSLETEVSSAQQLFKTAITSSDRMVYAAMAAASATEVIKTAVGSVLPAVVAKKLVNFHGGQTSVNSHSTGDDSFEIITEEETRTNDRKSASILALTKAITLAQESVKLLNFVGEDEKTLCDCAVFESHADVGCKEIFKVELTVQHHLNPFFFRFFFIVHISM